MTIRRSRRDKPSWIKRLDAGPPVFIQVAVGARWEDAVIVPLSELAGAVGGQVRTWLEEGEGAAVEIFFGRTVAAPFLGVRPGRRLERRLVESLLRALAACEGVRDVVESFRFHLDSRLFATQPCAAELGAVNAWATAGPILLWRRGGDACQQGDLRTRLARAPHLQHPRVEPRALELAWDSPVAHWVGFPVSTLAADA